MKKIITIIIVLFLTTTVLNEILIWGINEQIISRILFGMEYKTYMDKMINQTGLIGLISGIKLPHAWVFSLSKFIIAILCVVVTLLVIKKLSVKYSVTKKDFLIIIGIFSILSFYLVIFYLVSFWHIPPIKFFIKPIFFIIVSYICIFNMMYSKKDTNIL